MLSFFDLRLIFFVSLPASLDAYAYQDGITLMKNGTFSIFHSTKITSNGQILERKNAGKYFALDGTVFLDMEDILYYA